MKSEPIAQNYHPISAAVFSTSLLLGAFFAWDLVSNLIFCLMSAAVSLVLVSSQLHRKTLAFIIGVSFLYSILRLVLIALTSQIETSRITLPAATFPDWLGSLELGGKVDLSAVSASAQSMATLTTVVIAFCAFSFLVGPNKIIHLVPKRLHAARETFHIASNVLWRTPGEIVLLKEAQFNITSKNKGNNLRFIFPTFISILVGQSTTHAGVVDLRTNAIHKNKSFNKFPFRKVDVFLIYMGISIIILVISFRYLLGQ